MIKLTNKRLGALAAMAAIGLGGAAIPGAALAASASGHATVVKHDRDRDKPGVRDSSRPDSKTDSVDRSLDR
jgi:hypothetical protein